MPLFKGLKSFFILFVCLSILPLTNSLASTQSAKQWLLQQSQADGSFYSSQTVSTPFQATAEALQALLPSTASSSVLQNGLAYLNDAKADTSTENLARQLLVAKGTGVALARVRQAMLGHHYPRSGFGAFEGFSPDPLSTAYALEAMHRLNIVKLPASTSIQYLLNAQMANGGWGMDGSHAQVATTALVLHALWQYRHIYQLSTALGDARQYLLDQRSSDLWDNNRDSALALIALLSQGTDRQALAESVNHLQNQQLANGSFDNDVLTTALVLRALVINAKPPADAISLSGRLVNAETGSPLQQGVIKLTGAVQKDGQTDTDGRFSFTGLVAGQYHIEATKKGFNSLVLQTFLQQGDQRDLGDLPVRVQQTDPNTGDPVTTGTIRGKVTARKTGKAIQNAQIVLEQTGLSVKTGPVGSYILPEVTAGPVSLLVTAPGFQKVAASTTLKAGQTLVVSPALKLTKDKGVTLTGVVSDHLSGKSIEGALVAVTQGNESQSVATDKAGFYQINALSAGALNIRVEASGYRTINRQGSAKAGSHIAFSPEMVGVNKTPAVKKGGIRGDIVDAITGRGINPVHLQVTDASGKVVGSGAGDKDGHFIIKDLPPGDVSVAVTANGYDDKHFSMKVTAGFGADVGAIEMMPIDQAVNRVTGQIVDVRTHQPLAGVVVEAKDSPSASTSLADTITAADGSFTLKGLKLGRHFITFTLKDYEPLQFPLVITTGGELDLGQLRMRAPGIDALLPDLAVQGTEADDVHTDPHDFSTQGQLAVKVVNRGNANVTQPYRALVFSDRNHNGQFDPGTDVVLGEKPVTKPLAVDAQTSLLIPVNGKLPFRDAPLSVFLDADQQITELSEANNLASTAGECSNQHKPAMDLALCMDGSGSISSSDFQLQLEGTAQAIEDPDIIPRDGSVRVSVLQFNSRSRVEVPPTLVEEDNVKDLADAIRAIPKINDGTAIHRGIIQATDVLAAARPKASLRVIDVSTDGQSSVSAAVNAANRAQSKGIDAINAIGVGGGVNKSLLNKIAFPKPVGGNRGFVMTVNGYQQYMEAIAEKISRETTIPDLTVGGLQLIDHGTGQPVGFEAVVGNAGSATISAGITLTFYDGTPANGTEIGTLSLDQPFKTGDFQTVTLKGIDVSQLQNNQVTVKAVINGKVAECNTYNNTTHIPLTIQQGSVSLTLSTTIPAPGENLQLDTLVTNTGAVQGDNRVDLRILDRQGDLVADLGSQTIKGLAAGAQYQWQNHWNTGVILAAQYKAVARLFNAAGKKLDTDTASFRIQQGGSQPVTVGQVALATDQAQYRQGDSAKITSQLSNNSISTLVINPNYRLVVTAPNGQVVLSHNRSLAAVAIGGLRTFEQRLPLAQMPVGRYTVTGTMFAANGKVLDKASRHFKVTASPLRQIKGQVKVDVTRLYQGQTQQCHYHLVNQGSRPIKGLTLTRSRLDLENQIQLSSQEQQIDLQPGAEWTKTDVIDTSGAAQTRHACLLQAAINGRKVNLDRADYQVDEALLSLTTDVSLQGSPRLLVLADNETPKCQAVRQLTFKARFPETLSAYALVTNQILGAHYWLKDWETTTPKNAQPVDYHHGHPVNLTIKALDQKSVTLQLSGEGLVEGDYRVKTIYPYMLFLTGHLSSGEIHFQCGAPIQPGAKLGDFTVTDVELVDKSIATLHHHHLTPETPPLASQKHWLTQQLANRSYTLTTSRKAFRQALHSGNYQQYLLLADRNKTGFWTASQLREAVNRGEGLIHAAGDQPYYGPLYQALGVRPHYDGPALPWWLLGQEGPKDKANAITLERSPLAANESVLPLNLQRRLALVHPVTANAAGHYQNLVMQRQPLAQLACRHHPMHCPAITYQSYGKGKSVFTGFDLAAEGTAANGSGYQQLLDNVLSFTANTPQKWHKGQVVPVTAKITNQGPLTSVNLQLTLEQGGQILDTLPDTSGNPGHWQLSLKPGESQRLRAWIIPRYVSTQGDLVLTVKATTPGGQHQTFVKQLHPVVSTIKQDSLDSIQQALHRAERHHPLALVLVDASTHIHLARLAASHDMWRPAIREALKATQALANAKPSEAVDIRERLDWVIHRLNWRLDP